MEYSDLTRAEIEAIWEDGYNALDNYEGGQKNVLETLGQIITSMRELNLEVQRLENSSWSDFVDGDKVEAGGGSGSKPPTESGGKKWSIEEAKKDIQEKEQQYFHKLMVQAQSEGNKGLENWIKEERKKYGMNSDSGAIERYGIVPDEVWQKKKKNYGFRRGGETQLTGLHWLDGEKGKPERVLSAEQTKAFNKLVEVAPQFNHAIAKVIEMTSGEKGLGQLIERLPQLGHTLENALAAGDLGKNNTPNEVSVHFDKMINIEGNVDKSMDLEGIIKRASQQAIKDLQNTLSNVGLKTRTRF